MSSHSSMRSEVVRWPWFLVALVVGCAGVGVGLLTHSSGTNGQGGSNCGSVWFVHAYYGSCADWLDTRVRIVFGLVAVSITLLGAALVRGRGLPMVGWVILVLAGIATAVFGPRVWHDTVFLNFGY